MNLQINKKLVIIVLFSQVTVFLHAQSVSIPDSISLKNEYLLEKSIPYRDTVKEGLDEYAGENCQLDIYYPVGKKDFATVVWIHGGGLTGGKKEIPELIKNQGFAVVGIEYRKNPVVKCPVYIEDAAAAVAWVFNNIARYGGNPHKIYLSGHSAGGYLDLMIGMDKKWLAKHDINSKLLTGLIPLSPQVITHFKIKNERGINDTQPVIDEFALLFHVRKDLPPVVVITGDRELEMLGRYEENAYFERIMKLTGNTQIKLYELEGFGHSAMKEPGLYLMLEELKTLMKTNK